MTYGAPPLRAAIVGSGGIARTHGRRIRDLGSTVVAVAGRRLDGARELAADLPDDPVAYDDLEHMLDAERPDVLHVCSPHGLHAAESRIAIVRGIHVVSEKPLATSVADARAVRDLARQRGVHAAVCLSKRTYPMVAELRERVATGSIGRMIAVRGTYLSSDNCHDGWAWGFERAIAGDSYATADLGVHWLDLVEHVTGGRIARASARFSIVRPDRVRDGQPVRLDLEDYARVHLDLADGTPVSAVFTGVCPGQPNGLAIEVDGTEGGLDWREDRPNVIVHRRPYGSNEELRRDPPRLSRAAAAYAYTPDGHDEGFSDAFRNLFRDVYQAIGSGAAPTGPVPYPTFDDGVRAAVLVDAVVRAGLSGTTVDVPGDAG